MSVPLEIKLKFNAPQWKAHHALFDESGKPVRGRTVMLGWGRGVGKSYYRRQVWWLLVAQLDGIMRSEALEPFRGVRIMSLAPTLKQWKEIHWIGIENELSRRGKWGWLGAKLDRQTGHIDFPGGSIVRPFPAQAHTARGARGMRTDVLDADEFDDIDSQVYDSIAVPWLSEPWSLQIELPGGTPTQGRHGLWWRTMQAGKIGQKLRDGARLEDLLPAADIERYRSLLGEEGADGGAVAEIASAMKRIYSFHATWRDAPETVDRRSYARAVATTPKATIEREWEANADAGEGLVYPFDETFHVRQPPPNGQFREFLVGGDHGTTDPGVLLLAGVQGHGEDAIVFVTQEFYETDQPNFMWDRRAKAWAKDQTLRNPVFFIDPSRPDRVNDYRMQGCNVGSMPAGEGSINALHAGIARVANMLFIRAHEQGEARPDSGIETKVIRYARLYVAPTCKHTIREFGLYKRKKHPDGSFDEEPLDKHNHAMDALRYLVYGRFGRPPGYRATVSGR